MGYGDHPGLVLDLTGGTNFCRQFCWNHGIRGARLQTPERWNNDALF
jgi:hypothetical protein